MCPCTITARTSTAIPATNRLDNFRLFARLRGLGWFGRGAQTFARPCKIPLRYAFVPGMESLSGTDSVSESPSGRGTISVGPKRKWNSPSGIISNQSCMKG